MSLRGEGILPLCRTAILAVFGKNHCSSTTELTEGTERNGTADEHGPTLILNCQPGIENCRPSLLWNGQLAYAHGVVLYGDRAPSAQGRLDLRQNLPESLGHHIGIGVQKAQGHKTGLVVSAQR